ncbi:hypothetical protein C7E12_12000, partial [Stenotrophomonas maltophilia]
QQPVEYAKLAHLDGNMLLLALGLTLFASLAAGSCLPGAPCRCASNRWSTQSWPTWTATCCCSRWA